MKRYWYIVFPFFLLLGCTPKISSYYIVDTEIQNIPREKGTFKSPCYNPLNYAPDTAYLDHTPMKYIKLNLHYMLPDEKLTGFSEEKATKMIRSMYFGAQEALRKNSRSLLPEGNEIPALPIRHRYVLKGRENDPDDDGIYFHYDSKSCYSVKKGKNSTLYRRDMFEKYGIQKDTVLNIFLTSHHPDSLNSKKYGAHLSGVALKNFIKMMWNFEKKDIKPWKAAGTFNHEVGHIYGLVHAWGYNDGCEDTPKHSLKIRSNNIMDYNSIQKAWTPCQIGKTQMRMATITSSSRNFLVDNWCKLNVGKSVTITDSIEWKGHKDLEGNLFIKEGGVLKVWCRTSIPPKGKIVIEPGGKLVVGPHAKIHQSCGQKWKGIEIIKRGKKKGEVEVIGDGKIEDMMYGTSTD